MDEAMMLRWVKEVLEPWSKNIPDGIVPYLLLDSYKCHLMSSVVHAIQDLRIEVNHIPGGCTGLVQLIQFPPEMDENWLRYELLN